MDRHRHLRTRPLPRRSGRDVLALGTRPHPPRRLRPSGTRVPRSTHRRHDPPTPRRDIRFTIYRLESGEPVPAGVATLLPDHAVRTAEYIIMLAPEARGRGLGTQATRLTLDYAFHIANLRMVWLKVLAPNQAGIRAYEKAGFRTVGSLREAGYWLGQTCDEVIMDAVAGEFEGPSIVKPLLTN
ncbi:GNAT family N-acetyltransferase [Streptomyces nigrescens]